MAPPAVAAVGVGIGVRIRVRICAAVYAASAIRSPMKAGAAAARCERDRGWRLASRRERHRLRGRSGRKADDRKGRRNQCSSHGFAFRFWVRRAFSEALLNGG